nr:MAG TPA: hypothetical protein [Siphoviridae sp. ctDju21]DAJ70648.1 MAG TPA: hypothetical protein [Caudoviricetes sp.]
MEGSPAGQPPSGGCVLKHAEGEDCGRSQSPEGRASVS